MRTLLNLTFQWAAATTPASVTEAHGTARVSVTTPPSRFSTPTRPSPPPGLVATFQ
ncbi:hypothetical protein GUITHDRAFT_152075 [Guillardia theta CCMP2712]|uniref:Uncharacterized protein n=1 Tax=Guillardia theta (strain CCMP2712) TaxID=905079 RepID=L1JFL5_GUITC|nr:hypothetical protein GUITHDRAFT_152075 [Guillardia theta CCMP2712]EKX47303.1 hypothetical protein GUITHDRAFT_152075 [Guillardia theta CCMP2712]|eukprot:XP_005834283.1 hypothetical protein GUITHDRAFT_152075 [Guillardia theta CCMP2712]